MKSFRSLFTTIILCLPLVGQAKHVESGIASIYSVRSNGGTVTASGTPLKDNALTAAHKTLPLGSYVKVMCAKTEKSVVVKITDRGPYMKGRVIDLTPAAAQAIGLDWKRGITKVVLYKDVPTSQSKALKVTPANGAPFVDTEPRKETETVKNNNYKWVIIPLVVVYVIYQVKKWWTNKNNVVK
jgi:rare lipoprotein A